MSSPLPPPPSPPSSPGPHGAPAPAALERRRGQVSTSWQIMLASAWTIAFFAFSAVWKTSQDIGIGTWWLGARSQPQPMVIRIIPFALAVLIGLAAIYNLRRVALISLVGSFGVALIAVFDMSRSGGLAAIEFAIAASLALVSVGSLAGTYRARSAD